MSAFDSSTLVDTLNKVHPVGINPGHDLYISKNKRKRYGNLININNLRIKKKSSISSPVHAITNSATSIKNIPHLAWID